MLHEAGAEAASDDQDDDEDGDSEYVDSDAEVPVSRHIRKHSCSKSTLEISAVPSFMAMFGSCTDIQFVGKSHPHCSFSRP